jgi:hypothetical protein
MTDTAYDKEHSGSMTLSTSPDNKITIKANHVTGDPADPIGVYRWVDALHDFESYLKKPLNTLLRGQYGIGTIGKGDDFTKDINNERYASTKTTASRNTLHEILDHEEIWLQDSAGTTVITYPDTTGTNTTFTYTLPKLLGTYHLTDLPSKSILEEYPEGDLLLDIIGNKTDFFNKASVIKDFLGINDDTDTYSKDSANIPTTTFQEIFKPTMPTDEVYDYSFFSEILDPSSEQSDILTTHRVQLTLLYCMIDNMPAYITIQKREKDEELWYYAFHKKSDVILSDDKFHRVNFNKTSTGAHPAPNIETAVYFIKNEIQHKKISALLHDITTMVARMKNKSKQKLGYSLTKKEAQNVRNSGKFTDFYKEMLLPAFKHDFNNTAELTSEQMTTIIIAFKTIGDQMYLYDSILLSKVDPAKPNRQPWMVTGDTFLKDYGIYTKSTNIMCPTKYGREPGSRKLTVYIKPQDQTLLTPDEITKRERLATEKKEKEEKEKVEREEKEEKEKIENKTEYDTFKKGPLPIVDSNKIIGILDSFMTGIKNAVPTSTSTSRNITHFDSTPLTNIHGMTVILLYNAIVHIFLTYQKIEIIQSELGKKVGFEEYTLEQQKAYLQDYKERLQSHNDYVDFINGIPSGGVLLFINYVLINVSEIFSGITDISEPIAPLDISSFYIITTDIVSKLKDLHKHKLASTHLLFQFKDFQRQKIIMDKNLGSITEILQSPIVPLFEGGVSIPTNETEIIQMLKDDIDELLSYNTKLGGSTYYDKLNYLLTIINPTEDDLSKKEMGSIDFNLLYNISASYETAVDLDIDIEKELGYMLLSVPVVNKKRPNVIEDDGSNKMDVNVIEDDGYNEPASNDSNKIEVNVIEDDGSNKMDVNVIEDDGYNEPASNDSNKIEVNVIEDDNGPSLKRPRLSSHYVPLVQPNLVEGFGGKQTKRKRKNQSKTKHSKTKRKKTKRKKTNHNKTKRKKTKHNKTKRTKTKRNKKN